MKNNYIPDVFKEKILHLIRYFYALIFLFIAIFSALALLTFDINDNSFLTNTSNDSQNLLGNAGSYFASFIFYTFGVLGYFIILFFFLIGSASILINKPPKYIFIRLLVFFISLIIVPQTLIHFDIELPFIESLQTWGVFANQLYSIHELNYASYAFSITGIIAFLYSQTYFLLI